MRNRFVKTHLMGFGRIVRHDFTIDDFFNLTDFIVSNRCIMTEVETGFFRIDQRTALRDMRTENLTQCLVHQMGYRVVPHRLGTHFHIHATVELVTDRYRSIDELAVMAGHVGLNFLGIFNIETHSVTDQCTDVTHLTAGLGIKRCRIQNNHAILAGLYFVNGVPSSNKWPQPYRSSSSRS